MTNVAALYFYTDHGLTPQLSGVFASLFGLMNLFARSLGGIMSDECNKKYGMRGRLWSMFIVQLIEGAFCLIMGIVTIGSDAPSTSDAKAIGLFSHELPYAQVASGCNYLNADFSVSDTACVLPSLPVMQNDNVDFNLCSSHKYFLLTTCGSKDFATKDMESVCQFYNGTEYIFTGKLGLPKRIITSDLESGRPEASDCICNKGLVGALGIVSGMVGAGGNAGAVLTLWTIFKQVDRTDTGFVILGVVVMAEALLMLGIYFPQEGGLLFKAGALSYDPQRWKPPADLRGADQIDYSSAAPTKKTTTE